ncbi:MAG: hypothetical protein JNL79_34320 [Myxococcales bacterium]|nr:hypothetical protein [Myxococcales bacterium]
MTGSIRYSLRSTHGTDSLAGCEVEVASDGSALVVVDDEPLFRFASLAVMLAQYGLVRGDVNAA